MEQKVTDTIVAVATPHGEGGLAVIRVSGPEAFSLVEKMWRGKDLGSCGSHTAHLGLLIQEDGTVLDQAVATLFRAPNSFTGEDTVEISVHGSRWIQRETINRLVRLGARPAGPGEFSQRAFMNGRMDLAQAEAVADLISAGSKAAHRLAMQQMSGAFSHKLEELRRQLVHFCSLLELELDFSEEDVEFADRSALIASATETLRVVRRLAHSYATGKVFKEGVPVAIAGAPNAGKSTLLNRLLDDDKAIVSDIPGTTRDVIEDTREIRGTLFRFFDTAGLRDTDDTVERIGIERAKERIERAAVTLWVIDPSQPLRPQTEQFLPNAGTGDSVHILLINKSDLTSPEMSGEDATAESDLTSPKISDANAIAASDLTSPKISDANAIAASDLTSPKISDAKEIAASDLTSPKISDAKEIAENLKEYTGANFDKCHVISISAKTGEGLGELEEALLRASVTDHDPDSELIVTNARHYEALTAGAEALDRAITGLQTGVPTDLVAQDVRESLHHLGLVTGAVTTSDILTSIFQNFCIGK